MDSGAAAMPPPVDIVKVAIEWPGANAQLIEMDQVGVSSKQSTEIVMKRFGAHLNLF